MTSSYFSRLLPGSSASHSIYRTLDDQDEEAGAEGGSPEAARRIGYDPAEDFLEQELADARSQQDGISPLPSTAPSAAESPEITAKTLGKGKEVEKYPALDRRNSESTASNATFPRGTSRPRWMTRSPRLAGEGEELDDVPHSLLLDDADTISQAGAPHPADPRPYTDDPESAMHSPGRVPPARPLIASPPRKPAPIRPLRPPDRPVGRDYIADQLNGLSPRDRALWYWINVENLDLFLHDIYNYFLGKGIWSIMLGRAIGLMTVAFVVGLSLFLTMCVDYSAIPTSKNLNQVIIPKCTNKMSLLSNLVIWVFTFVWFAKAFSYVVDYRRLRVIQDFYVHLLEIPQADMQTVSWQDIVGRVMLIKDIHPQSRTVPPNARTFMGNHSKQKLDAHDIANRLMRKENYLIAMFNRDLLKLTLPIPFLGERTFFSKTLEWNINYCILDFAFNEQGHLRPIFLRSNSRKALSESLATRFRFAAVFSIVSAPFLLGYNLVTTFFRYFQVREMQ